MKLHLMPQRTPAWREARRAKFTASELGQFIVNNTKVAESARRKLTDKKLGELNGEKDDDGFQNDAMKRGTALEPIARDEYMRMTGYHVMEAGFIEHDTLMVGASPDLLVLSEPAPFDDYDASAIIPILRGGCEIKAPITSTQIRYLKDGVLPAEYEIQVHTTLAVSGLPWWDFFSWSPIVTEWFKTREEWQVVSWVPGHLPPFYIRTYRNALTEQVAQGLRDICAELEVERLKLGSAITQALQFKPLPLQ